MEDRDNEVRSRMKVRTKGVGAYHGKPANRIQYPEFQVKCSPFGFDTPSFTGNLDLPSHKVCSALYIKTLKLVPDLQVLILSERCLDQHLIT